MPDASKSGYDMSYHCKDCGQFWISETPNQAREKLCGPCEWEYEANERKKKKLIHADDASNPVYNIIKDFKLLLLYGGIIFEKLGFFLGSYSQQIKKLVMCHNKRINRGDKP